MSSELFDYTLRLADNGLVLAQRLGEWVGKGPVLEEDIASTNVGLDLLGQARLWLAYAGEIDARDSPPGRTEDQLAYFRESSDYRNLLIVEQPNGSYADTITRQFLFDQWHVLLLGRLTLSRDERIAAVAAKAVKEVRYHVERSADWMVRLGDGTDESHARVQAALEHLMPYAEEFWTVSADEVAAIADGTGADPLAFRADWDSEVDDALAEATLRRPSGKGHLPRGKQGQHSEHLSYLLGEMQGLARQHPGATW